MLLDDPPRSRQPESVAALLRAEERHEDLVADFGRDAGAGIDHLHDHRVSFAPRHDQDLVIRRAGLERVPNQVLEDGPQEVRVDIDGSNAAILVEPQRYTQLVGSGRFELDHAVQHRMEIRRLPLQLRDPDKREELIENVLQPDNLLLDDPEPLVDPLVLRVLGLREVFLDERQVEADRRQRVSNLVRESGEQSAEAGELSSPDALRGGIPIHGRECLHRQATRAHVRIQPTEAMSWQTMRLPESGPTTEHTTHALSVLQQGGALLLPTESQHELIRAGEGNYRAPTTDERHSWPFVLQRLTQRFWPGPLHIELGAEAFVSPSHPLTEAVLQASERPFSLRELPAQFRPALAVAEQAEPAGGLAIDDGDRPLAAPPATVRYEPATGLQILREGILTRTDLRRAASRVVVFVCTGNTCRSPLAAAYARRRVADHLGVPIPHLADFGVWITSAGLAAGHGAPASTGSLEAGAEAGLDLAGHQSQPMTLELASADRIFALSDRHVDALEPSVEPPSTLALLDPDGNGIADPFGGDLATYRRARDQIFAAIDRRLDELVTLFQSV